MLRAGAVMGIWFLLLGTLSGCADLQQKIVRKKKTPPKPTFFTEPVRLTNEESYRQRFMFWKSWQTELTKNLGGNHKKEVQSVLEARRHLAALPRYVEDEKGAEMAPFTEALDTLTRPLLKDRLSVMENAALSRRLEKLRLRVEKRFSPKKMKPFLKPDLPAIDLSAYGEEEEVPLPSALAAERNAPK